MSPGRTWAGWRSIGRALTLVSLVGCASAEGREPRDTDSPGLGTGGEDPSRSDESGVVSESGAASEDGPIVAECGNGVVEPGEDCDDGNDDQSDACTSECTAPACDDGLRSGTETDVDCGGACDPCAVDAECAEDSDCDTGLCTEQRCAYPVDCRQQLERVPETPDGPLTIDPDGQGGVEPFIVSCDMSSDGGGWIELTLQDSDGLVVGQFGADNPWDKCDDDGAQHFTWIDEGTITADLSPGAQFDEEISLSYQNPRDGTIYDSFQVDALRQRLTELSAATRMVALTADDDNFDWDADMETGHEVYVRGSAGEWFLLTPGTNGDCGGTAPDFPLVGSESAFYLWTHDPDVSAAAGFVGDAAGPLSGLPTDALLPAAVRLVVQSGGGVAFGWERLTFLVR